MRLDALVDLRVVILGFGREGQSAFRALKNHGGRSCQFADVFVWAEGGSLPSGINGRVAPFDARLSTFDVAIRSPGIRVDHPALIEFKRNAGLVVNPSSIFFSERPDVPVIGITGSKGKSTTASLLAHLLTANGQVVELAGNIGVPLLDQLDTEAERIVAEFSSYQLADLAGSIELGLITRLFPEHLDWHGNEAHYYSCKLRLAELLDSRPLLINATDPILSAASRSIRGRIKVNQPPGYNRQGDRLMRDQILVASLDELKLIGQHNLDNAALALAACELVGGDQSRSADALKTFAPLAHRIERIKVQKSDIDWINDSIATSPHATKAALQSLRGRAVVLIAGGQSRPADWSPVVDWCRNYPLAGLIVLPDNGPQIAEVLLAGESIVGGHVEQAETIEEAVDLAAGKFGIEDGAGSGKEIGSKKTILLSPGAPSFPNYKNFEERGNRFRSAVTALEIAAKV